MRLLRNIKRNPANASSLKMAHFSNIGVTEVFLEATPTTFITSFLLFAASTYGGGGWTFIQQYNTCTTLTYTYHNEMKFCDDAPCHMPFNTG